MNAPLPQPWTQDRFFTWAERQAGRWEFDGAQPVATTVGSIDHGLIMRALHRALDRRLAGSPCQPLGPDVGVATVGDAIRYPDALVTCTPLSGLGRSTTVPGAVVVFEIVSPGSGRVDRIVKPQEYAAIPTVRRYVILESTGVGLTILHRHAATAPWTADTLVSRQDALAMPELGIELPLAECYAGIVFDDEAPPPQSM